MFYVAEILRFAPHSALPELRGAGPTPLFDQAPRGGQDDKRDGQSRDRQVTIRHLEATLRIPVPKPRRERIIVERDRLGRIVHSRPPKI